MKAQGTFEEPSDLRFAASLLSLIDAATLVADRSGRVLFVDKKMRQLLPISEMGRPEARFLEEMIGTPLDGILRKIEQGITEVTVQLRGAQGNLPAQVKWLPRPDWLIVTACDSADNIAGEVFVPSEESVHASAQFGKNNVHKLSPEEDVCKDWVSEDLTFFAANSQMKKIRDQIQHVAGVNVPVFIWGESGTGKEVLARMVHTYSKRRDKPFVKVNCAALPGELLESELFGYEQGAFTGAVRPKPGKFETAHQGTIFLDEIAEMSSHLQSKLLHVLQDQQFTRLGGRSPVHVDVRVLAATNVDVQEAIQSGRLRDDLYYRLSVLAIHVPPLRERPEDIPLLLRSALVKYQAEFGQESSEPSQRLVELATQYSWPGNVRELENFAKRYVILGDEEESLKELHNIAADQEKPAPPSSSSGNDPQTLKTMVRKLKDEAEARAIGEALRQTRWCRKDAARMLGISYKALLYKIRQLGLEPAGWKEETQRFRLERLEKAIR